MSAASATRPVATSALDALARVLEQRCRGYFPPGGAVPFAVRAGDGAPRSFGDGPPAFTIVVNSRAGLDALRSLDLTAAAGAYLAGELDVEGDLVRLVEMRGFFSDRRPFRYAWRFLQPLLRGQRRSDRRWIAFHYDHDADFFRFFLDRRHRCYSQAVFARDNEPLEDAMTRKLDFAIAAIGARPGDHVLDVGGGWGAFTEHAGRQGIRVTSLTISQASHRFVRALIEEAGLPCRVLREHLMEHAPRERYDGLVNLGVTEHLPDYRATLAKYRALLKPGAGIYLDASASRRKHGHPTFTEKFLYPGNGSLLCLHEYLAEVARTPLRLRQVHDDRHSYYLTTRRWAENLDRHRAEVEARWGKALFRRFQLWLWGSAISFRADTSQAYRVVMSMPP